MLYIGMETIEPIIEELTKKAKEKYKGLTKAQLRKVAIMMFINGRPYKEFSRTREYQGWLNSFGICNGCCIDSDGEILIRLNTRMLNTLEQKGVIEVLSIGGSFADKVRLK